MRRRIGLVRLAASQIESRKASIDAGWIGAERDGDDQLREDTDGNGNQTESDEDRDVEMDDSGVEDPEDDESDGEDEPTPLPARASKRKRLETSTAPPPRPSKKVSFASDPKESKRARAAASIKKATPAVARSKSILLKTKPTKATNINSEKASQRSGRGGEEAYDFGKFF